MPTLNEAAEVLRLRKHLSTVLGERHAETCQSILLDCDCKLGHRQGEALAAYRAALGEKEEGRG